METKEMEQVNIPEIVAGVLNKYPAERRNLLPILHDIQEKLGYLPIPAIEMVSGALGVFPVDLYGAATVFTRFRLYPPGRHQIKVCMGTACYLTGGEFALNSFERRLDIKVGETTQDREFSLEEAACLGCCSLAPVAQIDGLIEGSVTPTKVDGLLLPFNPPTSDS